MKKWTFWIVMCAVSLLNGATFFGASLGVMQRGLDGIDNQASLLFIPFLWIIAAFVLVVINAYTLIRGIKIGKDQMIGLFDVFCFSGLSAKAKAGRIVFITMTCLFILFGYSLFASQIIWAAAYALSGGLLLLFLYAWRKTYCAEG